MRFVVLDPDLIFQSDIYHFYMVGMWYHINFLKNKKKELVKDISRMVNSFLEKINSYHFKKGQCYPLIMKVHYLYVVLNCCTYVV